MNIDVQAVLSSLKDFQRATVDHVFNKLFIERSSTRFLIADEVGLGKTLVARGIIARAIKHLQNAGIERVDVVYICSNSVIAQQNINRLNITGDDDFAINSRLTLLPVYGDLNQRRINFISLTPGTSLNLRSSQGVYQERVLLFHLLDRIWQIAPTDRNAVLELLRVNKNRDSFEQAVDIFDGDNLSNDLLVKYRDILAQHPELHSKWRRLVERFQALEQYAALAYELRSQRVGLVGELRRLLALTCVDYIEPDLIILDEFQRFRNILHPQQDDDMVTLAHRLFAYVDEKTRLPARVLMLSATPYKMYTSDYEKAIGSDNHHEDFLNTCDFLQPDDPQARQRLQEALSAYGQAFAQFVASDGQQSYSQQLLERKAAVESLLKQMMVRTERLAAEGESDSRNGMLRSVDYAVQDIHPDDLAAYLAFQKIARKINHYNTLEYWKSAPYLLNFMREYQFKEGFKALLENESERHWLSQILDTSGALLDYQGTIAQYRPLNPANGKLRLLIRDYIETQQAWQLLWIPPSLSYYRPGGVYADREPMTKRIIFSGWRVVPKVISALMSYETERRIMQTADSAPDDYERDASSYGNLINFSLSDDRPAGMSSMVLLYPSMTLAEAGDPLDLTGQVSLSDVIEQLSETIQGLIDRAGLANRADSNQTADPRWYWMAPVLLDHFVYPDETSAWFEQSYLWNSWHLDDDGGGRGWRSHVQMLQRIRREMPHAGALPDDLARVLARIALASPAVCGLRALGRLTESMTPVDIRRAAGHIAWSMRTLFNTIEATALIRGQYSDVPYWQAVLRYSADGNIQAVLDEYAHILRDSLGLFSQSDGQTAHDIAVKMGHALSVRTVPVYIDHITADNLSSGTVADRKSIRTHFAMSLLEDGQERIRANGQSHQANLRDGFNSPFWPFVLTSTSIGQEGLDFHQYCHAIIHWNLPYNPVDLEQREGRVHRYKGHAVRRNLAARYGDRARQQSIKDIWEMMFEIAAAQNEQESDLSPYWILSPDGNDNVFTFIERYVPLMPFSQDIQKLHRLRRMVAHYRMVFGQVRQEDMLDMIMRRDGLWNHVSPEDLQINLSPYK